METLSIPASSSELSVTNSSVTLSHLKDSLKIIEPLLSVDENIYLTEINEKELKAYYIAKKYLGSSFDLKKSNGFLRWKKEKE